jgi:molybdate transport system permease protein
MPVLSGIDWFPLWLSLRVAVLATAAALVAGTWMAYMLSHKQFRGKELLDSLITLPLVLPPTVLGYYALVVLGRQSPVGRTYEAIFNQPLVFTWQWLQLSFTLLLSSRKLLARLSKALTIVTSGQHRVWALPRFARSSS